MPITAGHNSVLSLTIVVALVAGRWVGRQVGRLEGGSRQKAVGEALTEGTRSGLWSEFARAIDEIRPRLVVIENVRGLLSAKADNGMEYSEEDLAIIGNGHPIRAMGAVLGDLADLGFDAKWAGVRASDAGAPHQRFRIFIVANTRIP